MAVLTDPVGAAELEVGREFLGQPKPMTLARLLMFSGGPLTAPDFPKSNIHTDAEFARSTGVPGRIASGTQYQSYLVELMLDVFGDDWLRGGTMEVKLVALVHEGETVRARAKITETTAVEDGALAKMHVWCENEAGKAVLVGTATGLAS